MSVTDTTLSMPGEMSGVVAHRADLYSRARTADRLLLAALAIWAFSIRPVNLIVSLVVAGNAPLAMSAPLLIFAAVVVGTLVRRSVARGRSRQWGPSWPVLLVGFYVLSAFVSTVLSDGDLPYLAARLGGMVLCICFALSFRGSWASVLAVIALASLFGVVFELGCIYALGGSLHWQVVRNNPMALAAVAAAILGLGFRRRLLRVGWLALPLAVIVLTKHRTSLVAVCGGLLTLAFLRLWHSRRISRHTLVWCVVGLVLLVVAIPSVYHACARFVVEALDLAHAQRGLPGGLSGRFVRWERAWNRVLERPFLGWGARSFEEDPHNGLLSSLMKFGFAGTAFGLGMLLVAGCRLLRLALRDPRLTASLAMALMVAGSLLSAAESYFLNIGNPTSIGFLMVIAAALVGALREETGLAPTTRPPLQRRRARAPELAPLGVVVSDN